MGFPSCESCKRSRILMVAMAPGKDGKEWWLCPRCYQDGLRNMNGELNVVAVPIATEPKSRGKKPAKAPAKPKEPERSTAKAETASFDPHPNEPEPTTFRFTGGTYVPDEGIGDRCQIGRSAIG